MARRLVGDPSDQRELHVQDGREVARELLEHPVALRARHRERRGLAAPPRGGAARWCRCRSRAPRQARPVVVEQRELEVDEAAQRRAVSARVASNTTLRRSSIAWRSESRTAAAASGGSTSSMVRPTDLGGAGPTSCLEGAVDVQVAPFAVAREHHHAGLRRSSGLSRSQSSPSMPRSVCARRPAGRASYAPATIETSRLHSLGDEDVARSRGWS